MYHPIIVFIFQFQLDDNPDIYQSMFYESDYRLLSMIDHRVVTMIGFEYYIVLTAFKSHLV